MERALDRTHLWRAARTLLMGVVIEIALIALADRAPAMASLIRPLCWVIGLIFVFGIFNAFKTRRGVDRRHGDRREGGEAGAAGAGSAAHRDGTAD